MRNGGRVNLKFVKDVVNIVPNTLYLIMRWSDLKDMTSSCHVYWRKGQRHPIGATLAENVRSGSS